MRLFRKVVDERQELEMMRVERGAFWLMFFMLAIAIPVQLFVLDFDFAHIAGEFIVLVAGAVYMLIGDIRHGTWDYFTRPGIKSYIIYGFAGAFIFGLAAPLTRYFKYGAPVLDCLRVFAYNFIILFVITFLTLLLMGSITKKRQKKLQQEYDDGE